MITPYLESLIRQGKAASKQFSKTMCLGGAVSIGIEPAVQAVILNSLFKIENTGKTIIITGFSINAQCLPSSGDEAKQSKALNLKINGETLNSFNYLLELKGQNTINTPYLSLSCIENTYIVARPDQDIDFVVSVSGVDIPINAIYGNLIVKNIDVNDQKYQFPNKMGVLPINPILHQVTQLHNVVPEGNNVFDTANQRTFSSILDSIAFLAVAPDGNYQINQNGEPTLIAVNVQYVEIFGSKVGSGFNF